MKLVHAARTDTGRKRGHNEDAYHADPDRGTFMVADGVGGSNAGEVASAMVVGVLSSRLRTALDELRQRGVGDVGERRDALLDVVGRAFKEAAEVINKRSWSDVATRGMATTAVALQVVGNVGIVGHVGDSRLYMIRNKKIYQITEDHTLLQQLKNRGLSDQQLAEFPHRHVLSRSIGTAPTVEADVLVVDVFPDDRFLLCTDGLHDLIGPQELLDTIVTMTADAAAQRLVARANEEGGRDNITLVLVEVGGAETAASRLRTEEKANFLSRVFLFRDLTFPETVRLLRVVRDVRVQAGDIVFREGDPGDELYIVVEGSVAVTQKGVYLTTVEAGGHFGELSLVSDGVRSATAQALTDTLMLGLRRQDFFDLVNTDHRLAVRLLWGFVQNLAGRTKTLSTDLTGRRRGASGPGSSDDGAAG